MKRYALLISFLLVICLPNLMFAAVHKRNRLSEAVDLKISTPADHQQTICVMDAGTPVNMELEEYVLSVLLGEVPASFETEALKAQAVAVRTYTLRKVIHNSKHTEADVCTNANCCQAFVHPSDYSGNANDFMKIKSAVMETSSQVLTYQGDLIEATYFSCSGGKTEDAIAVWGTDVPYLKSVDSPGEENAKLYISTAYFPIDTFLSRLGLPEDLALSEETICIRYSHGGGAEQVEIAAHTYSGTQFRTLLELPSTAFSIEVAGEQVKIITKGNGHRVGMSQYGAEAMAVSGKSYEQILSHYYSGTNLVRLTAEEIYAVFDKAGNL